MTRLRRRGRKEQPVHLPQTVIATSNADADAPTVRARIEVPTRTILKVVLSIVIIWLAIRLSSVVLEIFCALLLTAALDPLVTRLEGRGWKRSTAVTAILLSILVISAALLTVMLTPV